MENKTPYEIALEKRKADEQRELTINSMVCPDCGSDLKREERIQEKKFLGFVTSGTYSVYLNCNNCGFEHYHYLDSLHLTERHLDY